MNLQRQPRGSKICGHCCVAMVTGASLQEVIAQVGHRHGTSARELGMALRAFGLQAQFKLTGFKKQESLRPAAFSSNSGRPGSRGTGWCTMPAPSTAPGTASTLSLRRWPAPAAASPLTSNSLFSSFL